MEAQAPDAVQCTRLVTYLKQVPDPRRARGIRHPWWVILVLLTAGTLSGHDSARAIAQWAREHRQALRAYLPLWHGWPPSSATLQRALAQVDLAALERLARRFLAANREPAEAVALDGKTVCGASLNGPRVHLVALAEHGRGRVLAQAEVDHKTNEITVAPELLKLLRPGQVMTVDALLCQRALAAQVVSGRAHYLMAVKDNQPGLLEDLVFLFEAPRQGRQAPRIESASWVEKNRGRIETRTVERSEALVGYLDWPGLGQVLRRICRRERAGKVEEESHYYVTSLTPAEADLGRLAALCRGHWTIENQTHRVRDVTFGEDASRLRTGHAPAAMATLRNLAMALIQDAGYSLYTDARRHYAARPERSLRAIGCGRL